MKKVSTLEKDVSTTTVEGKTSGSSESSTVSHTVGKTSTAVSEAVSKEGKPNRPIETLREGAISASVWARDVLFKGQPRTFYSVSFQRSYQDRSGKTRYTEYFGVSDLGQVIAVAKRSASFIEGLQPADREILPDQAD